MLWDQVEVEGVLLQECLAKVVPSHDGGHVKRGEPLEGQASQTFLEQADQQPLVCLELSEISAVRLQMGNGVAPTIVFIKIQDTEYRWEHRLRKVTKVLELVGLVINALH